MRSFWKTLKSSTRTAKFGMVIIVLWILCAIFADVIAPYGPNDVNIMLRMKPPAWMDGGSSAHLLGTDEVGRDVLSRLIYGCQISLIVGLMSVVVSLIIGTTLGLVSGFFGGKVDAVIMRACDVMLAFPFIFMALCFMAVLGSGAEKRHYRIGYHWLDVLRPHGARPDAFAARARVRARGGHQRL